MLVSGTFNADCSRRSWYSSLNRKQAEGMGMATATQRAEQQGTRGAGAEGGRCTTRGIGALDGVCGASTPLGLLLLPQRQPHRRWPANCWCEAEHGHHSSGCGKTAQLCHCTQGCRPGCTGNGFLSEQECGAAFYF